MIVYQHSAELTVAFAVPILPQIGAALEMQLGEVNTAGNGGHRIVTIVAKITGFCPYWNKSKRNLGTSLLINVINHEMFW